MANIEEKVENLVEATIEKIGYELYDVEYVKVGKNYFLRIVIDKQEGINIEDCEKVNHAITDLLDEANYIKEPYFLEVSSPGVERILRKEKHLQQNIGNEIKVKLFQKDEKRNKEYQGILQEFDGEKIRLKGNMSEITIERKKIAQIKTIYNWEREEFNDEKSSH